MNDFDILSKDNVINSVYPLVYWIKNEYISEYSPNDFILGGRGTAFLYKTGQYKYLVTLRHNYDDSSTFGIVNAMKNCLLHKEFSSLNRVSFRDLDKNNLIRMEYLPLGLIEEYADLCFFRITANSPKDEYFLEYQFPKEHTLDKGYVIGYPQDHKKLGEEYYHCSRAALAVSIDTISEYDKTMFYHYQEEEDLDLNGFSGGPLMQYNTDSDSFIFTSMVMSGTGGRIRAIPASVI